LRGPVSKNISLRTPIISGERCSVEMAIAIALEGGMGIVGRNQTVAAQVEMISRTKRFLTGFITDPKTIGPKNTVADMDRVKAEKGFSGLPVTENGKVGGKLIGIVTARDADRVEDTRTFIEEIVNDAVITATEPITYADAKLMLLKKKVGKLLIVDAEGRLTKMLTRADVKKVGDYPEASKDKTGALLVGAAVVADSDEDWSRARAVAQAGANVLFVEVTVGSIDRQVDFVKTFKQEFPEIEIIAGPICNCRAAMRLAEAGVDALRVGNPIPMYAAGGEVASVGRAEATATYILSRYLRLNYGIRVIADGGLETPGRMLKAFSLGASAVILDDAFAGTDEAPRDTFVKGPTLPELGCYKVFNGGDPQRCVQQINWSTLANTNPSTRILPNSCSIIPKNISKAVGTKGSARSMLTHFERGLRHGMQDLGIQSIAELHTSLVAGTLRLECRCSFATQVMDVRRDALEACSRPHILPVFPAAVAEMGGARQPVLH